MNGARYLLIGYILLINLTTFIIVAYDKAKAKMKGRRVPEASFFALALIGGATGVFLGMQVFRHKTRHLAFAVGMPVMSAIDIALVYLWMR